MAVWNVIQHTELGASASSVTFGSISGSYDHLYIEASARSDDVQYYDNFGIQFNGDTGSNYSHNVLLAGSSSPMASKATGTQIYHLYGITGANNLADTFGTATIWIPNYANTSNYKQVLGQGTVPNNSTTDWQWTVSMIAGLWSSTSAITSIVLFPAQGLDDFVQYSTFTLYGINGAA
jgi:hypothetical protein